MSPEITSQKKPSLDERGEPFSPAITEDWTNDSRQTASHYGIAVLLLSFYSIAVCPLIRTFDPISVVATFSIALGAAFALRMLAVKLIARFNAMEVTNLRIFAFDFVFLAAVGMALCLYYETRYQFFPWHSAAKIIFGFASMSFFIALDLALHREATLRKALFASGASLRLQEHFTPIRRKFVFVAITSFLLAASITILVVMKDIHWIARHPDQLETAKLAIIGEILFVAGVMSGYVVRVLKGFADRVGQNLNDINTVLAKVRAGDLSATLPITSVDEFGRSAALTNHMIDCLSERTNELQNSYEAILAVCMRLASLHDDETGGHIARTQAYVDILTSQLMKTGKYRDVITPRDRTLYTMAAPLHDIGKVGIPEGVLRKPGKLSHDEFELMKTHTLIGDDALGAAERDVGKIEFLDVARGIAIAHHEKWDGSGYPNALAGEDIPLPARIMALADVYDALRSARPYKSAFDHEKARGLILEGRGSHFDPDVVDAFLAAEERFIAISREQENASSEAIAA
ncbi:MAG: HD domain-containing phosphohydrolase [Pseudomonadota bacterium]